MSNPVSDYIATPELEAEKREATKTALKNEDNIALNFIPGTYGTFLELACNVAGGFSKTPSEVFMNTGNAHLIHNDTEYWEGKRFWKAHFYQTPIKDSYKKRKRYIEITISPTDHFLFDIGLIKRLHNLEFNELEIDTFNKLEHLWLNDSIAQFLPGYGIDRFDCPKIVLMDFFRIRYKQPWSLLDDQAVILKDNNGFQLKFIDLFTKDTFIKRMEELFEYVELPMTNKYELSLLYDDWLAKQTHYKKYIECQEVLINTVNGVNSNILLDCSQQGYIIATLENKYNIEIRDISEETFSNLSDKLKEYI